MTTWNSLYYSQAIFQSDAIDISSDFEKYINSITLDYTNNDGIVKVEVRTSFDDGFTWSEWVDTNHFLDNIFYAEGSRLNFAKMQYRVIMEIHKKGVSPVFRSFSAKFTGAFKIFNTGDEVCKPEIWIKKTVSSGNVQLKNETNGQVLKFDNLNNGETVFIDCENKDIMSDLPMTYRYNNHNGTYLRLEVGENVLTGIGDCEVEIRCEFKVLQ